VCVSSSGIAPHAQAMTGPSYQVPFAETVRRDGKITLQAVGMTADPDQAEAIIAGGRPDCVPFARAFLDDPALPWHAADALGAGIACPPQYHRSRPNVCAGPALAHPPRRRPLDHTLHSIVAESRRREGSAFGWGVGLSREGE